MDNTEGEFETHITVNVNNLSVDFVQSWADQHGLKFHHIILARGGQTSQPMVTFRGQGHIAKILDMANRFSADLSVAGFPVVRVKIEAAVSNPGIPEIDTNDQSAERYFEHHVKLLHDSSMNLQDLTILAIRHTAHLSRNARRAREDGREERFVTQRCFRVGLITAGKRLNTLVSELSLCGYSIVSIEKEYVVFDSAPAVDAGWIDPEDVRCFG